MTTARSAMQEVGPKPTDPGAEALNDTTQRQNRLISKQKAQYRFIPVRNKDAAQLNDIIPSASHPQTQFGRFASPTLNSYGCEHNLLLMSLSSTIWAVLDSVATP